jgi:hypothetical protein
MNIQYLPWATSSRFSSASGGQGALFEKTAPWTPAKAFSYAPAELLEAFALLAATVTNSDPTSSMTMKLTR